MGAAAVASNWSKYSSGFFNDFRRNLNHDILLVGYISSYNTIIDCFFILLFQSSDIAKFKGKQAAYSMDLVYFVKAVLRY
jgi:hypothetical protein